MKSFFQIGSQSHFPGRGPADTFSSLQFVNGDNNDSKFLGTDGDDSILGFAGDDVFLGTAGADRLNGGTDFDTIDYSGEQNVGIVSFLGGGFAGAFGQASGDVLIGIEHLIGTKFDDILIGDDEDNLIEGFAGTNDILMGEGGNDVLRGAGTLDGGGDDDDLNGSGLSDTLRGGDGNDALDGGFGADKLEGGAGIDTANYESSKVGVQVFLGALGVGLGGEAEGDSLTGIETLKGSNFADTLAGADDTNMLQGFVGDDTLKGLGGADSLYGGLGADTLEGGDGNDLLDGGHGGDVLNGGAGFDVVDYFDSQVGVFVDLINNRALGSDADGDTFFGVEGVLGSLFGDALLGDDLSNDLRGDFGNDVLRGNGGNDALFGSDDEDRLFGGSGNDRLSGGEETDTLVGGSGNDVYVVDSLFDIVDESSEGGSGLDRVGAEISYNLSEPRLKGDIENVTLKGTANANVVGSALSNELVGNSGTNTIDGRAGADRMAGGGGRDSYRVDNVGDIVDESTPGAGGVDEVGSTISFSLLGPQVKGTVENLDLQGAAAINGAGNSGDNRLDGNNAANDLMGLGGNDELRGGLGADTFVFNAALNAATNVDTILDFSVADDTMRLENAFMTALGTGQLAAGAFHVGAAAHDGSDRIIYNKTTGDVLYDADGTGAGAAIRFADLSAGLALTSADFLIV